MQHFSSSLLMLLLLSVGTWIVLMSHPGSHHAFGFGFVFRRCSAIRNEKSIAHKISKANNRLDSSAKGDMVGSHSNEVTKQRIFELLDGTPPNEPTPQPLTWQLLQQIRSLEEESTDVANAVPPKEFLAFLAGNWELVWTAQDVDSQEYRTTNPLRRWINPLENQSYSNNPSGRKNPILPINMQNRLQQIGVLSSASSSNTSPEVAAANNIKSNKLSERSDQMYSAQQQSIRSTQSIDVKKKRVRNVVRFGTNIPLSSSALQGTLTVDITFVPSSSDFRRIDVKFQKCRLTLSQIPLKMSIPLGFLGPTGWLRTTYVDQDLRITRGHKGSVFLLLRTSQK